MSNNTAARSPFAVVNERPATERQLRFAATLLREREIAGWEYENLALAARHNIEAYLHAIDNTGETVDNPMTSQRVSTMIDMLMQLPKLAQPVVANGYYALEAEHGATAFYRVDSPTEGKWAGFTFVKIVAGPDEHNIKNPGIRKSIITRIAANPLAASTLYGQKIGRCGVCHTRLTNEESRERGIGPVCASKF